MKTFIKEYLDLCKKSGEFYKKHWKGIIVIDALVFVGELVYFYGDEIKYFLEEKISKKDEESE